MAAAAAITLGVRFRSAMERNCIRLDINAECCTAKPVMKKVTDIDAMTATSGGSP